MARRAVPVAAAAALALSSATAAAQGIPVIDRASIIKEIEAIAQLKSQLDMLNQQLRQAQELYGSLNKLTDMADVASVLNDPSVRKAMPEDFASIKRLFDGSGSGVFGNAASKFLNENSTFKTAANDFYARELSRLQKRNAGEMSLGQQTYDAAGKRIDGIDELRRKISTAKDAKEIADLQARLQAETAFLQTDVLRMQALRMIQQAEIRIDEQRRAEDWRHRLETMKEALE